MGNCQAAEASAVVIQHPAGKKAERIYFPVTARHVMGCNPGYFVALVVPPPVGMSAGGITVKHLKLLRPGDSLLLGKVYRLVCVDDVVKEFAAKQCMKLAKLLEVGGVVIDHSKLTSRSNMNRNSENHSLVEKEELQGHCQASSRRNQNGGRHWKPALQSISELGF